jgi:hypothetical protein
MAEREARYRRRLAERGFFLRAPREPDERAFELAGHGRPVVPFGDERVRRRFQRTSIVQAAHQPDHRRREARRIVCQDQMLTVADG